MNLPCSTQFPKNLPPVLAGKDTFFIKKIWIGLIQNGTSTQTMLDYYKEYQTKFNYYWDETPSNTFINITHPKLHTIREDLKNRWEAGKLIHFYIKARTVNQFQFAPVIPCVSTQSIQILWHDSDGFKLTAPIVYVDNKWIVAHELERLARNDGFNNLDEFFAYFSNPFKGKIVHWTNLKY